MNVAGLWCVKLLRPVRRLKMRPDITIFARDFPDVRLLAEVKPVEASPAALDAAARQLARYMWGANCHYGLLFTPTMTYVLRDDFTTQGPEAIKVHDALPTERVLSRMGLLPDAMTSERELASLARGWLERLATSYEAALPDDAEVTKALFPELVSAVAGGRVEAEEIVR
jgi:hypothetical protein